jgi:hypothetical protein
MTEVHPKNQVPYGDQHEGRLGKVGVHDGRFVGRLTQGARTHNPAPGPSFAESPARVLAQQNKMQTEPKSSYHVEQFGSNAIPRRKSRLSPGKSR